MIEKGLSVEMLEIDEAHPPADMAELNPYMSVPTLIDRELALYDSRVILDYLDERFPHPALLPPNPIVRAQLRVALHRIERDWYGLEALLNEGHAQAKHLLTSSIMASVEIFAAKRYFMSDEFTIVDASIAPVLHRLTTWGVVLPQTAKPVFDYAKRLWEHPSVAATRIGAELPRAL